MSSEELEERLYLTEQALCTLIRVVEDKLRLDPWNDRFSLETLTGYTDICQERGEEDKLKDIRGKI